MCNFNNSYSFSGHLIDARQKVMEGYGRVIDKRHKREI